MTVADVDALLDGLRKGDRVAEQFLVEGSWDHLRDDPSAAALHPWLDAVVVGRLPREQRPEALSVRRLSPSTWTVAIGRPVLPRDARLVTAWLHHQGIDAALAARVRRVIDGMPDAWEAAAFGDVGRDGRGDADGDGYTDLEEYLNAIGG